MAWSLEPNGNLADLTEDLSPCTPRREQSNEGRAHSWIINMSAGAQSFRNWDLLSPSSTHGVQKLRIKARHCFQTRFLHLVVEGYVFYQMPWPSKDQEPTNTTSQQSQVASETGGGWSRYSPITQVLLQAPSCLSYQHKSRLLALKPTNSP